MVSFDLNINFIPNRSGTTDYRLKKPLLPNNKHRKRKKMIESVKKTLIVSYKRTLKQQ